MEFVSEQVINQIIDRSESGTAEQIAALGDQQPVLLAYLVSEQFELLTPKEKDYFIYLAWILHQSIYEQASSPVSVNEASIGQAEEAIWEQIEQGNKKDFRKMLDPFFEHTQQEDLLAFIEDSLVSDDEDFITPSSRELMFVGLKTVMDVLTKHPNND
ncbi:MAG: hypothetical protein AAF847_02320 [Bacteroidota bacterium]